MKIVWAENGWLVPGLVVLAVVAVVLAAGYARRRDVPPGVRWSAAFLKLLGFAFLFVFILRPEVIRSSSRPGANHWVILSDNSASMTIKDRADGKSHAERLKEAMGPADSGWRKELAYQFTVDHFTFDSRLRKHAADAPMDFKGTASSLSGALDALRGRYEGRPLAGVLVLTDGSPTDTASAGETLPGSPPVFPLVLHRGDSVVDLSIPSATAQVTLFEDAPVMVDATVSARGVKGKTIIATLRESGTDTVLGEQRRVISGDDETWMVRFQAKPKVSGTTFTEVEVRMEEADGPAEATLENNKRGVAANRDAGPYRVLYVGGRPNYEHKFLQRALEGDSEVRMTSLLRIAKREPKFDFRGRQGENTNPLYRGFESHDDVERFDEAVFIRLNTTSPEELSSGFPRTPEEIFPFEAIIIDDAEAALFDHEQQRLLQRFVSERGGGLIVLGGMESLDAGGYKGTPIGEMLPVYLDPETPGSEPLAGRYELTREGRLEPWARLKDNEGDEDARLSAMPDFRNVHRLPAIRPGSTEVARLSLPDGGHAPALVTRRFGRGRTAVLAITDFWRWGMTQPEAHAEMEKAWRQTLRWLLADVPHRLTVKAEGDAIEVELFGPDFRPDESASVALKVQRPDGTWTNIAARPHPEKPGVMQATFHSADPGNHLVEAATRATEKQPALTARSGWVANSLQDEFRALRPDMEAMGRLASATGGRVLSVADLSGFVDSIKNLPVPVTETRREPLWHSPAWLALALACFVGEWGLRRWKRLP
jgi:hypothetical protein